MNVQRTGFFVGEGEMKEGRVKPHYNEHQVVRERSTGTGKTHGSRARIIYDKFGSLLNYNWVRQQKSEVSIKTIGS